MAKYPCSCISDDMKDVAPTVTCEACKYWDKESGLSVRECQRLNLLTVRYWFCADAEEDRSLV